MKKRLLLLTGLIASSITLFAQSFSGPTSATTGSTITLTGVGEATPTLYSSNYEFTGVSNILSTETTTTSTLPNALNYVSATVTSVTSVHSSSGTPTTLTVNVTNIYSSAITITFYVHAGYNQYLTGINSYNDQKIAYTITINPPASSPTPPGAWDPSPYTGGTLTNYLWRLDYLSNNQHMYTSNHSELVTLANAQDSHHVNLYRYEGVIGFVYKASQTGTVPLHRLQKNGDHLWTIDQNEVNTLSATGWSYEGNAGYVYASSNSNAMPVYRYRATSGSAGHFYTSDWNELGSGSGTWQYEGVAYYILTNAQ